MTYAAEDRAAIIQRVVDGLSKGTPLTVICAGEGMPTPKTIRDWRDDDETFAIAYARAREDGFDAIAEECLTIADDGTNDFVEKKRADGSEYDAVDSEHIQRSKLRVETRLKLLAKWDPKRYGDKTLVGSDPENPLPAGFSVNLVRPDAAG